MSKAITLPALGEGVSEVTIARWLKRAGDPVKKGEPLLEVETDKITTEICAEADGTLAEIALREGAHAKIGATVGSLSFEERGEPHTGPTIPEAEQGNSTGLSAIDSCKSGSDDQRQRISPVVSRMVAEHGLDLSQIAGSGEGGRVTKQDVLKFLAQREPALASLPAEKADATTDAAFTLQPLTVMRRRIAEHMVASVRTSPHVTTIWEVDFAHVMAHRAAHKLKFADEGIALTPLAYAIQAATAALKAHPLVNSQWREAGIALMHEFNIGIAVALEEGLLVPVIHRADELSLKGIARRIGELAAKARVKQLVPADMQAGTFTITNHGATGSLAATPIIHQPQCAILGLGAVEKRVKVMTHGDSDAIVIRPCAFVSLTFDHRILDGAVADAFVASFKRVIESPWADAT